MEARETKSIAVYLSFATLRSAVGLLRTHGLPRNIDRTAWGTRSGAEQTQLLSAFKFLGFIDDAQNTQQVLVDLVALQQDTEAERELFTKILRVSYASVFELDLKTATPGQLNEAIGKYGVTGSTRDRAVRFFIKAAEFCKIPLSPRFANGSPNVSGSGTAERSATSTRARRRRRTVTEIPERQVIVPQETSGSAMKTIQLHTVGGTLTVSGTFNPFGLIGKERELVYSIIDKMNEYEISKEVPKAKGSNAE
jgi:hypothetical protein